jgi:hypothetical protein
MSIGVNWPGTNVRSHALEAKLAFVRRLSEHLGDYTQTMESTGGQEVWSLFDSPQDAVDDFALFLADKAPW